MPLIKESFHSYSLFYKNHLTLSYAILKLIFNSTHLILKTLFVDFLSNKHIIMDQVVGLT
jgi:hypothetical protein